MARTSNRRIKAEESIIDRVETNSFQTAIYTRISRDKKKSQVILLKIRLLFVKVI